ncbi:unnamed protein product [Pleuronectes platessa]|uniref:Uncharacterized protein n=1 Tax=Pleuronectes platessa TaxID=8262 RepID=A0A9N7YP97_PLEPL|nr:unnamed protein product [Pleuronectes platessa]
MGPTGKLGVCEEDGDGLERHGVRSPMDREQRLIKVIWLMQMEIRKLEMENMGLRRRAGANLRKNATVPIILTECRESVVMTVRRYPVFQPRVSNCTLQLGKLKNQK